MKRKKPRARISSLPLESIKKSERACLKDDVLTYSKSLTVAELAKLLEVHASQIIKLLMKNKKMVMMNSTLDDEDIGIICLHFGYDFNKEGEVNVQDFEKFELVDDPSDLVSRPPVVTVMGHVDHGKTTLIDAIRSTRVVDTEVGGISQAIGAYQKEINGQKITFIDTPGHEAFTAMRSRGAAITDIVVLVVAADDSVMPQTKEAIDHAKVADVPIIVAINKIDKVGINIEKVKSDLTNHGIIPEEYGGEHLFVEVSAKQKIGIDELLETILLVSEMRELKANPHRFAVGTVIEAKLDKGEGPKATLLIENGTLKFQDFVVVGSSYGRIRKMTSDQQKVLKVAGPSTPVSIIGLSEVPHAGDPFVALNNEKQARDIATRRRLIKEEEERAETQTASIEDLYARLKEQNLQFINVIIKADTTGSAEAIRTALEKLDVGGIKVNILAHGAGGITEGDVLLASTSEAIIFGFNVRPNAVVKARAVEEKVEIRLHRIIYALIEEVEKALRGQLVVEQVEKVNATAEVREIFTASKLGTIAGSYITSGVMKNQQAVRLIRNNIVVYEGKISSMKRFKDDVREAREGYECGIVLEKYNDIKQGDIIEGYEMVDKK